MNASHPATHRALRDAKRFGCRHLATKEQH